jgi:homoserine dehydrogenase
LKTPGEPSHRPAGQRLPAAALEQGMHAITANKGPVVHAYQELMRWPPNSRAGVFCLNRR